MSASRPQEVSHETPVEQQIKYVEFEIWKLRNGLAMPFDADAISRKEAWLDRLKIAGKS